jgi:CheY-like chemotaxis protein/two-component sensor histidine kinase
LSKDDPVLLDELRSIMLRQVEQLSRLSEDLLDVARIAQGKFSIRHELVELDKVIADACEAVRPFIDRCGHTLSVELEAAPSIAQGDASRLLQVFTNLLQNAAKFTPRNGRLHVSLKGGGDCAVIRVRDSGPGISAERIASLFAAPGLVDGAVSPGNDGLGIGLQLVKTIVELHGGAVEARSDGLGQGSEFVVKLPLLPCDSYGEPNITTELSSRHTDGSQRLPRYRIVVVDDDRSTGVLLSRLLQSINQTVSVVSNGADAIEMVLRERPKIVFIDLMMYGMSGFEVAQQLRAEADLDGLVLIALSGRGDEVSKTRAFAIGFDQYLVKPTSIAELTETLRTLPTESTHRTTSVAR